MELIEDPLAKTPSDATIDNGIILLVRHSPTGTKRLTSRHFSHESIHQVSTVRRRRDEMG